MQWDYGTHQNVAYHKFYLQDQQLVSENNQQAAWGSWYWTTQNTHSLTHQSGSSSDVRGAFQSKGKLANTKDTNYGSPADTNVVFGFALDLGHVRGAVSSLFTIGITQEIAIQFASATGIEFLPSLWTSYFSNELDSVRLSYIVTKSNWNTDEVRLHSFTMTTMLLAPRQRNLIIKFNLMHSLQRDKIMPQLLLSQLAKLLALSNQPEIRPSNTYL